MPIEEFTFPTGINLLSRWQANDPQAIARLKEIFDDTIEGAYDDIFKSPAPQDTIHVTGPVDLTTLTIVYRLYGITTEQFYKQDAERFIRTSLMVQKLLGMNKLYISWPVYGLTAEALGQKMIYSDQYSPGTDPDKPMANKSNWQEVATPDLDTGIPKLLEEYVSCYSRLTGLTPILHLSAAYSLAADIYGQEQIISALTHEPEFVNQFVDHLVDVVLQPWIDHFLKKHPQGLVELSDASGSPFFIGPDNCKNVAIRSIQKLIADNPWGDRVYDANYRGDYVTQATRRGGSSRRRGKKQTPTDRIDIHELFKLKNSVCRDYVIRLAEDRTPTDFYVEQAIKSIIPLYLGIGATQVDRNSIADMDSAKEEIQRISNEFVAALKKVASSISDNGYDAKASPPWPGAIYFEDISAESSFKLIEIIVDTALKQGELIPA